MLEIKDLSDQERAAYEAARARYLKLLGSWASKTAEYAFEAGWIAASTWVKGRIVSETEHAG